MSNKLGLKRTERRLAAKNSKVTKRTKILRSNRIATKPGRGIQMPKVNQSPDIDAHLAGHDENLLQRARTQWQFGDWESLATLDIDTLQHHPDRAELALLVAESNIQIKNDGTAKQFIRLAQDWGCSRKLVSQILIAGVHNTLGRTAALMGLHPQALKHFESAVAIGMPRSEVLLLSRARASEQYSRIGLTGGAHQRSVSQYADNSHHAQTIEGMPDSESRSTGSNIDYRKLSTRFISDVCLTLRGGNNSDKDAALGKISNLIQRISKDHMPLELAMTSLNAYGREFRFVHVVGDYIPRKISDEQTFYESTFLELLQRFHRPGGLIVDGGANIGNHTIYFAKMLGAKVIAFEPEPHNASCLAVNVALNGISDRVQLHRYALGQTSGVIAIQMNVQSNFGSFTARKSANPNSNQPIDGMQVYVPMQNLDVALSDIASRKNISILKLDVEGMESDILQGANKLIHSSLPVIAVECFSLDDLGKVESFLEPIGYFPIEFVNATPTFLFVNRNSPFHLKRLADYLRTSAVARAMKKNGFV